MKRHNEAPAAPDEDLTFEEPVDVLGDGMADELADDLDDPGDDPGNPGQADGGGATRRRAAVLEDSDEE